MTVTVPGAFEGGMKHLSRHSTASRMEVRDDGFGASSPCRIGVGNRELGKPSGIHYISDEIPDIDQLLHLLMNCVNFIQTTSQGSPCGIFPNLG